MQNTGWYYSNNVHSLKIDEYFGNCNISIRPGGFCTFNQQHSSNGLHYHNCFELCIVTNGSGEFIHDNKSYRLKYGDVFIADPRILHEIRILMHAETAAGKQLNLFFYTINIISDNTAVETNYDALSRFLKKHNIITSSQSQILSWLYFMENYCSYKTNNVFGLKQAIFSMVLECLISLSIKENKQEIKSEAETSSLQSETTLDLAIGYINRNILNKFSVNNIATHSCTSIRNLQYLFRKHLKKTIVDYINEKKVTMASNHLKMNFKVSTAGQLVGIEDPARFSRLFKKYYGMSPKKFQMLHASSEMVYGSAHVARTVTGDGSLTR
jgi:AraC-like DNA-binding protein